MARSQFQAKNLDAKNLDLLLYFNLIIGVVGSVFLAWQGVQAGTIYTLLFLSVSAGLFLTFFHLKDDARLKPITNYVRIPIGVTPHLSKTLYLLGLLAPLLVQLIIGAFSSFNVAQLSVPVFGQDINTGLQSFAQAQIEGSMAWRVFVIMFVAGGVETFAYNFGIPIIGVLLGYFTLKLINDVKSIGPFSPKTFIVGYAMLFSVAVFTISHQLNDNYTPVAFAVAALFLLISNLSIYYAGVLLVFWMGYHQMNNLLWLIGEYGLNEVLSGFISPFGLIFAVYVALIVYSVLRSWPSVTRELRTYTRGE